MKILRFIVILIGSILLAVSCIDGKPKNETILEGKLTLIADETLTPLMDDQIQIFESEYNAKITLAAMSEAQAVNGVLKDTGTVAILARKLTDSELKVFERRKIIPKVTPFAKDGVVLISNTAAVDTVVDLESVYGFINGRASDIKGLVFDNPNSSTVRFLTEKSGAAKMRESQVFSFASNAEVIKYVSENNGMIGVIGMNWIAQPTPDMAGMMSKIKVLSVRTKNSKAVAPTQESLAEGIYPLARDLFIVNCQGFPGLGTGFASFIAGEKGQRIVLKSGLLPVRIPGRKIITRNKITKEKRND